MSDFQDCRRFWRGAEYNRHPPADEAPYQAANLPETRSCQHCDYVASVIKADNTFQGAEMLSKCSVRILASSPLANCHRRFDYSPRSIPRKIASFRYRGTVSANSLE